MSTLTFAREVLSHPEITEIRDHKKQGFSLLDASKIGVDTKSDEWISFCKYWDDLVLDQYLPARFGERQRRHSRFEWPAKSKKLIHIDGSEYIQALEYNPLFGGIARRFAPIRHTATLSSIFENLIFIEMMFFDLDQTCDWIIEIDFMRTVSDSAFGFPCPEGRHRDGYEHIGIHLIGLHNIAPPQTEISDPSGKLISNIALDTPGKLLLLNDLLLFHYTYPFKSANPGRGWRDTMLTGYRRKM